MRRYTVEINGTSFVVDVREIAAERFIARLNGAEFEVRLSDNGALTEATITPTPASDTPPPPIHAPKTQTASAPSISNGAAALGSGKGPNRHEHGVVVAPLPGSVESILVKINDYVNRGDALLVLEAMKMQNTIQATEAGVVREILVQPGQTVRYGDALLVIEREQS